MQHLIKALRNRNFLLILAILLGLLIGDPSASLLQPAVLPLLALTMTLAVMNVKSADFLSLNDLPRAILFSLLLNYLLLGGTLLLMAYWLIDDKDLWNGFVILAAVPPAVALTPFSHALGGDTRFALVGMITCYLAAIVIMPLIILFLLNVDYFEPWRLLQIMGELIIIPILASRLLLLAGVENYIAPWKGTILNWSFFFVIFTLIGLNRQAFLGEFNILIRMCAIAFTSTFVLGYVIEVICKALKVNRGTVISFILMGTLKNYALAGGVLLNIFNERSTIPPSLCVVFGVLLVVWLGFHLQKHKNW